MPEAPVTPPPNPAAQVLLDVSDLRKSYAGRRVVDGVSFVVREGEIVGLLGPNGAGKTTSFRMTVGMITPEAGSVKFLGRDITAMPMYRRARLGMGYLSQDHSIFRKLTVEDNLLAICETLRISARQRREKVEQLLVQFGLTTVRRSLSQTCSGGEKRRLEIARALITSPRLILLDEPFSGVDPRQVEDLRTEIVRLRDSGVSILLTDHNVYETLQVTDRSYVIVEGKVIREGKPYDLATDPLVREKYLGLGFRGDALLPADASSAGAGA
ncbi:MAG: LPS export ABC transporter ATP-binding protein [Planctomycetia bacterium]|nr:MAG: LPS export ABC transporter ATP-binding protein [Planctomycetia bacterium]